MHGQPKVAIVCDWLTNMGGAEHLVYSLHKAFPEAPIYTSVFTPEACPLFAQLDVRTTYLQHLPKRLRQKHQLFPVFRAHAFRSLDLSEYDIVISSASAEAKAIRVRDDALHICYCHTPTRYYWSHYKDYLARPGFGPLDPLMRLLIPPFVSWMRRLDLQSVAGVDAFIANSHEVQERIKQYYHREATVIFPPVEVERLQPENPVTKADFYLAVGRQIPYKRVDLAIQACNTLRQRLVVIGNGSEHVALQKLAGPTIELLTNLDDHSIVQYFQQAKALLFPAYEDFGIVPVEAMAAGTPVIAYGKGGALDTVKSGVSGLLFNEQTVDSLIEAIQRYETMTFDCAAITAYAKAFDESAFIQKMQAFVANAMHK